VKRKIIEITEDLCNGCGECIPNCPEGALQIIDGKVRLISDLFCDGLGACIGHCPTGAIKTVEREAEPYDERKVMENIVKAGHNTIVAHLVHLHEHNEKEFLKLALESLKEKNIEIDLNKILKKEENMHHHGNGCPGSKTLSFEKKQTSTGQEITGEISSELRQWPIQLHLVSPNASYFTGADVVLAADCVAFALGDFHRKFLKGKALAIACPKLDSNKEVHVEKLKLMLEEAKINTLTVIMMEVPCCKGLLQLASEAASKAKRKVPVKAVIVGIQGEIISEEWI
jgi:ferredoxin